MDPNSRVVQALYNILPTASNEEAAEIGLALQRVIRGENLEDVNPQLAARYREYMAKVDRATEEYERDRQKFVDETIEEGRRTAGTDEQRAKLAAKGAQRFQAEVQTARLKQSAKRARIMNLIENGPKREVYVNPRVVMGRVGENQVAKTEGLRINIQGVAVYVPPGKNLVPEIIADRIDEIQRSDQETTERKEALQNFDGAGDWRPGQPDGWDVVSQRQKEIDAKYKSKGDPWDDPKISGSF